VISGLEKKLAMPTSAKNSPKLTLLIFQFMVKILKNKKVEFQNNQMGAQQNLLKIVVLVNNGLSKLTSPYFSFKFKIVQIFSEKNTFKPNMEFTISQIF
jgi:hypothetical protein